MVRMRVLGHHGTSIDFTLETRPEVGCDKAESIESIVCASQYSKDVMKPSGDENTTK